MRAWHRTKRLAEAAEEIKVFLVLFLQKKNKENL
jgi:hypothetical protein